MQIHVSDDSDIAFERLLDAMIDGAADQVIADVVTEFSRDVSLGLLYEREVNMDLGAREELTRILREAREAELRIVATEAIREQTEAITEMNAALDDKARVG